MPQLFQPSYMKLSGAGQAAQALSDAGDLGPLANSLTEMVQAYKQKQLMDTPLSQLGLTEQQALLAGGASPGNTFTVGPDGSRVNPQPIPANMMTGRDLMRRHAVLGDKADTALSPSIAALIGPQATSQLPSSMSGMANLPYPIAEKMGGMMRVAARPQVHVNSADLDAFNAGNGSLPAPQPYAAQDGTTIPMDPAQYRALQQNANYQRLAALDATPEDRQSITDAVNGDRATLAQVQLAARSPNGTKLFAQMLRANPSKDFRQQAIDFEANKGAATTTAKTKAGIQVGLDTTAGTMKDIMGKLQPLLADNSSIGAINKLFAAGKLQGNDAQTTTTLKLLNDLAMMSATQAKSATGSKGAPSKEEVAQQRTLISSGLDSKGLAGLADAINFESASRSKNLQAAGGKGGAAGGAGARVNMIDPSGKPVNVRADQQAMAISKGYKLAP